MSKTTSDKTPELKGKQKKIAASKAKKTAIGESTSSPKQKSAEDGLPNYGCCCTCAHFPHKVKHETQPCKVSGNYVARKAKFSCYKCKFG